MATLEVESVFTNIPLNETISNCVVIYIIKIMEIFSKFLQTATSESSFIFDYLLYKQVDGVTMVSPLGPIFANAFIRHYEKEWLGNCPIHFKPMIYKRYVDDIFGLFSFKEHPQLFE